jgi:hypothetical protein
MYAPFVRSLALLCGLLLVPPPGWCCLVSGAAPVTKPAKTCCGCPLCRTTNQPAPGPPQPPRTKCPCFERTSMLPAAAKPVPAGGTVTAPLFTSDPQRDGTCVLRPEPAAALLTHSCLHLVYCTWLC